MTRARKETVAEQFDMFLPYLADLPLRDQHEMMERLFFSLAKTKRVKPIDYTSPDGQFRVNVSPNPQYGMATIWDADILIYCASTLADMARRGINDVPRKLHIMPYDLLRAIGRPTTGRAYELLGQALDRLVSTTIKTKIRAENRREATFSWLDGWTQLVDERTERSRGMTLELSNWFWEGMTMKGGVFSIDRIDRAYFNITEGRERWLYRVARKHAGGGGEGGFTISMPVLFEKSGAEGPYRRFKFEIQKRADKDELPGYALSIELGKGSGEPLLRMRRVEGKDSNGEVRTPCAQEDEGKQDNTSAQIVKGGQGEPARTPLEDGLSGRPSNKAKERDRAKNKTPKVAETGNARIIESPTVAGQQQNSKAPYNNETVDASNLIRSMASGLSTAGTRGYMTDETIAHLREKCPGWDLYALHAEFERWVQSDANRTPADWQRAFVGWVKRNHVKHRPTRR